MMALGVYSPEEVEFAGHLAQLFVQPQLLVGEAGAGPECHLQVLELGCDAKHATKSPKLMLALLEAQIDSSIIDVLLQTYGLSLNLIQYSGDEAVELGVPHRVAVRLV